MKVGGDHLRLIRHPLEPLAEIVHFASLRNFGLARYRAEHKPAAVEESYDALIERHDGTSLLNDRREDVVEIERGSDLLRNFQERVENVHFAFGLEQIRVMESNGCLLADALQEKKLILVE